MAIIIRQSEWGTTHPFVARMFLGMIEIRNFLAMASNDPRNKKVEQSHFDELYEPIRKQMETLIKTASIINSLLTHYKNKIDAGEVIKFKNENIEILESIDYELNKEFGNILDLSIIVSKSCLQKFLLEIYDLDIGFLYQRDRLFYNGIKDLINSNKTELSDYLIKTRQIWFSEVNQLRIEREHHSWILDKIVFIGKPPNLLINYPQINQIPVNLFSRKLANRTVRFVEDMIAYGFQDINYYPVKLIEIDETQRDLSCPKRFMAIPINKIANYWKIKYHENFDFI